MQTKVFKVKGMMCAGCENRVKKALSALEGVKECEASAAKEEVVVVYDESLLQEAALREAIEDTGYDVV